MREYLCVPDILSDLEVKSIRLVTNNPYKVKQISRLGVSIEDRIDMIIPPNKYTYILNT